VDFASTDEPIGLATVAASVCLAVVVVYTDIRWGKIFNVVTVPFAVIGLVLNSVADGVEGALLSLGGIAAGFALWFLSGLFGRVIGGGDIKLLMAFGALMGPVFMLWTFLLGAIIGGVIAVGIALRRGLLQQAFRHVVGALYMRARMATPMEIPSDSDAVTMPYAVALCSGALITIGAWLWG